jgi:hypothetical protein
LAVDTGFGHAAAGLVPRVLSAVLVASRRGARGGGAGTATAQ